MITLDTNLTLYPGLYYYLPMVKNKNANAYSSIDSYTEARAAKSASETENTQQTDSAKETKDFLKDYSSLIKALKLELPASKFAILKEIPHTELLRFLFLFDDKQKLLNGINFFTKDKILEFISHLPKDKLLDLLFKIYISKDELLERLPIKELNFFLTSTKIDKNNVMKIFKSLSKTELAQILEAATGMPQGNKSHVQLMDSFKYMEMYQIAEGIKGLEYKKMREIISDILQQDPKLYMEFTQTSLFNQTIDMPKSTLVMGMGVLESDQLIKYLDKLPDNLLALVVTQIDTELLAQILVNNYQNLLSQITA